MTVHRFGVDPREIMTSRETQELGKNAARESGLAKKNIVRDEGIEKKIPQHKDSMKKIPSYRKSPPPNQNLNGRPLRFFCRRFFSLAFSKTAGYAGYIYDETSRFHVNKRVKYFMHHA